MGYETKIFVVQKYNFGHNGPITGDMLAQIDLCKCGGGPVGELISSYTKKPAKDSKPPFSLYAFNPERQQEAVELLREVAGREDILLSISKQAISDLSDDIEDGTVDTDCYGDYLGVIPIDEMIEALQQEIEADTDVYRRFKWALALLQSIYDSYPKPVRNDLKVVTYGH